MDTIAQIHVNEQTRQFHLTNGSISYIFKADDHGKLISLYAGAAVPDRPDFSYLIELQHRSTATCRDTGSLLYSLEHLRQEFPEHGTGDYRLPAIVIAQESGSRITDFVYARHRIVAGKPALAGLPATYVETPDDACTLQVTLADELTGVEATLSYTVFAHANVIARSVAVANAGAHAVQIERLMSLSVDMPDCRWDMTAFTGAWARERIPHTQPLHPGLQQIGSTRGASSHAFNPTMLLCRPGTTEAHGDAMGVALVYSGNHDLHVEVDTFDVARIQAGINDFGFSWHLAPGETFQAPEALLGISGDGIGELSAQFHRTVREHIVRGPWKHQERPILINNWEATYFNFDEDRLVSIAKHAQEMGVELLVLDDGWFGSRSSDTSGLGDWTPNLDRLPGGLTGLARRINDLGMQFGLWFEPEAVNLDSNLCRAHPDWLIHTPDRALSHGRNEYLLDFTRTEVVEGIYDQMYALLSTANISYIKWDMNRYISEAFDLQRDARHQGEFCHRYILGVYALLERLLTTFPDLLIEGCASGGGRFDMGMLHYTPQIWCSDDSDAVERMKIQYGTSVFYPLSSIGAHVSCVPNHQVNRTTPLETRAQVAMFGTFGYELDLDALTADELECMRDQVAFFKQNRSLFHTGSFYRLRAPYTNERTTWMVVAPDRSRAIVGDYRILLTPNAPYSSVRLQGLDERMRYRVEVRGGTSGIDGGTFTGAELMRIGLVDSDASSGELGGVNPLGTTSDFASRLFILTAVE